MEEGRIYDAMQKSRTNNEPYFPLYNQDSRPQHQHQQQQHQRTDTDITIEYFLEHIFDENRYSDFDVAEGDRVMDDNGIDYSRNGFFSKVTKTCFDFTSTGLAYWIIGSCFFYLVIALVWAIIKYTLIGENTNSYANAFVPVSLFVGIVFSDVTRGIIDSASQQGKDFHNVLNSLRIVSDCMCDSLYGETGCRTIRGEIIWRILVTMTFYMSGTFGDNFQASSVEYTQLKVHPGHHIIKKYIGLSKKDKIRLRTIGDEELARLFLIGSEDDFCITTKIQIEQEKRDRNNHSHYPESVTRSAEMSDGISRGGHSTFRASDVFLTRHQEHLDSISNNMDGHTHTRHTSESAHFIFERFNLGSDCFATTKVTDIPHILRSLLGPTKMNVTTMAKVESYIIMMSGIRLLWHISRDWKYADIQKWGAVLSDLSQSTRNTLVKEKSTRPRAYTMIFVFIYIFYLGFLIPLQVFAATNVVWGTIIMLVLLFIYLLPIVIYHWYGDPFRFSKLKMYNDFRIDRNNLCKEIKDSFEDKSLDMNDLCKSILSNHLLY
jgi:hypothetical protein